MQMLKKKGFRALSLGATFLVLSGVFTSLLAITYERTYALHSQCSDGIDNDTNDLVDYPQDPGCSSADDDYEGESISGNFITITDDHETVQAGDAVVYRITLKQQREDARVVNLDLHLPYQANVVSASDGGAVSPGAVRWTNVSVYKNVTRVLTINVNISPDVKNGQYLVARVNTTGAQATDTTLVDELNQPQSANFSVSVSDGKEYVLPGEQLTYTVRARYYGTKATNADVRLTLPYDIYFVSASDDAKRDSYNVTWKNVHFEPNDQKTFTATVQVDYRTADRYLVRSKAYVGTAIDTDQTVVRIGLPYDAITATITDNRDAAQVGQLVTYIVKVKNDSSVVGTNVSVDASLPQYGEFVSATEGGWWDGSNVRWLILQIAPHDTRTLTYTVRVRSDAPLGSVLTASVAADGYTDRDKTTVGDTSIVSNGGERTVLFRKHADSAEAVPGSNIRYTLYVRNTLDHAITDAVIVDRFDSGYLALQSYDQPQNLARNLNGEMQWRVPVLEPGQSWQVGYVLSVSRNAPNGLVLDNIASIRGSDLDQVSLVEKVSTNKGGVLREFPETGFGMDALLAMTLAAIALVTTGVQRKAAFGRLFF
jgi:uncharacterized repeat protein (TIGR01451 family)